MSGQPVNWCDISVADAKGLAEFYENVMGWKAEALDMGDYSDYVMRNHKGEAVGGICHAKGPNESLPPVWLPYFTVDDVNRALTAVVAKGGRQVTQVQNYNNAEYCVIEDPSGAFCALFSESNT